MLCTCASFAPTGGETSSKRRREEFDKLLAEIVEVRGTEQTHPDLFGAIHKARVRTCMDCRRVQKRCEHNPDARRGSCLALYRELTARPCAHCGTTTKKREAHHEDPSEKIHRLSDASWWAWNGGEAAMFEEILKCISLCMECHGDVSDEQKQASGGTFERSRGTEARKKQRHELQAIVNAKKKAIGKCQECSTLFDSERYCFMRVVTE